MQQPAIIIHDPRVHLKFSSSTLASIVLPVPGGPVIRMPFHGRRMPLKKSGRMSGSTTASSSSFLASVRPAISPLHHLNAVHVITVVSIPVNAGVFLHNVPLQQRHHLLVVSVDNEN